VDVAATTTGGGGSRRKLRRRRPKYWSESLEPAAREVIIVLAAEQVENPVHDQERVAQLESALARKNIALDGALIAALEAERERLIGIEVAKYLQRLMEREDEDLLLVLAEAL
jgi:hypothetical protein